MVVKSREFIRSMETLSLKAFLSRYVQKNYTQIIETETDNTKTSAAIPELNKSCKLQATDFLSRDFNNVDPANNFTNPSSNLLNEGQKDMPDDFKFEDCRRKQEGVRGLNINLFSEDQNTRVDGIPNNTDLAVETFQHQNKLFKQTQKPSNSNSPQLGQTSDENFEENAFENVLLKFIKGPNTLSNQMPKQIKSKIVPKSADY